MYSMTMSDTCATHVLDKGKSESCLVKAPAMHASESVLVVGELLCTSVQANTERHTRNETREMCSCWGYKQHSSSRKSGEWRDSNFQQLAFGKSGKLEKTLENFLSFKGLAEPQIHPAPAARAVLLSARFRFSHRRKVVFKLTCDDTGDQLSRVRIIQASLVALSRSFIRIGHRLSFCVEEFKIIVGKQQLDRIMSVLKFCHMEQIIAWSVWSLVHVHPS